MSAGATPRHRLFRAMVVMGGSMAVGCGGIANQEVSPSAPSGAAGTGQPPQPEADAQTDAGTTVVSRSPDPLGNIVIEVPEASAPTPFDPGSLGCPETQWACPPDPADCNESLSQLSVSRGCHCEPSRPLSIDDCRPGETLACRIVSHDDKWNPLDNRVAFNCVCVPAGDSCRPTCATAFPAQGADVSCQPSPSAVLCGCAVVYLQ